MENKRRKKSGMMLVEVMVAITIFTIGIAGFTLLFVRVWQGNSYALEMGQSAMAVSEGMNKMVDYIRGARQSDNGSYPLVSVGDNDLVLYSDYDKDGTTERLHFYKSGNQIIMGYREPSGTMPKTYANGDQASVVIADRIVNDAGSPVFLYYDKNYSGAEGQSALSAPISVSAVRLVKVHLFINIDPNRAPDNIETQSFVEIRNLNDYNKIE